MSRAQACHTLAVAGQQGGGGSEVTPHCAASGELLQLLAWFKPVSVINSHAPFILAEQEQPWTFLAAMP